MQEPILSNCDREQIHIPGSIQPYGVLLVTGPHGRIVQASSNVPEHLGLALEDVLGLPERDILGKGSPNSFTTHERTYDITRRLGLRGEIVELEPQEDDEEIRIFRLVHSAIGRIRSRRNIRDAAEETVDLVRQVCGFDRVVVYRFLVDDTGEVIAESKIDALESYLGRHFPATDIPTQARALYVRNWTRLIGDVNSVQSPIVPELDPETGHPLDLSDCTLRSVSPTHIQYLKNMGVTSSMSISIVVEGRLWGLIACHHMSARIGSKALRQGCELLGQVVSIQMAAIETRQYEKQRKFARDRFNRLSEEMRGEATIADALTRDPHDLLELVGASGAAFVDPSTCRLIGATPSEDEVRKLADFLSSRCQTAPLAIRSLASELPGAKGYASLASGVLALCYSRTSSSYVLWFRPEYIHTVIWAGVEAKSDADSGPNGDLGPRASFSAWSQDVRLHCRPWTQADLSVAAEMRVALMEEELTMLNSMLESQVQQRTAQLEKALDDLSDFTYSVAHNLRAPLRGMIGNSRIIFEDYAGDVSSGLKKKLRAVESNALKLAGLIDDLLAFAQLNRTEMAPVMLELSELVEETPDRLKQQGKQFGAVELTVQPNMTASADRSMVEDLFEILIGNAIKYKSAGGPAKVGVGQKDGVFFVHDEGIGFDPEYAGRLFKPFERLHRDGEYAGNGIGLANAKRIVERHGGEIRSTGRIDHGATFYFTLSGHLPERTD